MAWPPPPLTDEEREVHGAAGARVRALRQSLRLTQGELGALVSLSASHIGRLERGVARWRESTLDRVLEHVTTTSDRPAVRADLAEILADAFAAESAYRERIDRRRRRREWARRGDTVKVLRETAALSRRLAKHADPERATMLTESANEMLAKAAEIDGEPMPDADVELMLPPEERLVLAVDELYQLKRMLPGKKWSQKKWRAHFDRIAELEHLVAELEVGDA